MSSDPARVSVNGGAVKRMVGGKLAVTGIDRTGACEAAVVSTDLMPGEVHSLAMKLMVCS